MRRRVASSRVVQCMPPGSSTCGGLKRLRLAKKPLGQINSRSESKQIMTDDKSADETQAPAADADSADADSADADSAAADSAAADEVAADEVTDANETEVAEDDAPEGAPALDLEAQLVAANETIEALEDQ
ncbi:MAG: hypothetical protein V3T18_00730, partial [Pseudomonadales bacterium]